MAMLSKPFKPPLLNRTVSESPPSFHGDDAVRPIKRQRVSEEATEHSERRQITPKTSVDRSSAQSQPISLLRKPLSTLKNTLTAHESNGKRTSGYEAYYTVLWRKYTAKKHKTWDGDGVLVVRDGYACLRDISGRDMGRLAFSDPLLPGSTLSIGGKDIEVDSMMSRADFLAGNSSSKAGKPLVSPHISVAEPKRPAAKSPSQHSTIQGESRGSLQERMEAEMARERREKKNEKKNEKLNATALYNEKPKTAFKIPMKDSTLMPQIAGENRGPRHDPHTPGALVMERPSMVPTGKQVVDVVLDPLLGQHLREHQRRGVAFLYECVMGIRDYGGKGCILADEMGLGKTLQTIALLWTLLKQNPISNAEPIIKKALIVCPVTLISNWKNEFRKWLGNERIGVFVADGKKTRLTDFTVGKSYNVMIIGYERLRSVAEDLTRGAGIDIVIADEGHRLKTVQNKSAQAIQSLNTPRRIILSGTPIQNDLSEFFSMVNFVNDGLLGTYKQFVKNFENPIVKSRQPNALPKDIELGESRSEELAQETSKFILRRTADVISKFLPPKIEYVLFCNPTPTQANIYRKVLASPMFQWALGSSESALQLITILKKLCNSPSLLSPKITAAEETANSASITKLLETLPQNLLKSLGPQASSKIRILDSFLYNLSRKTSEKIVLVSNYTSTLDLLKTLLTSLSLPFLRLDGSTPTTKRQSLVDDFNRSRSSAVFAFLLSAKAGGLGLNLIGASRLVLFDVDWNPAVEQQAMARIHREGQKKPCKIYRFVLKGGLEERVWQRQVVKRSLATSIMDGRSSGSGAGGASAKHQVAHFSREELRDLFRLDESSGLRTHELVGCSCQGKGRSVSQQGLGDLELHDEPFYVEYSKGGRGGIRSRPIFDSNEEDDEDDNADFLPDINTLIKASSASSTPLNEEQERTIVSGTPPSCAQNSSRASLDAEKEMQGLMEYIHLDTSTSAFAASAPADVSEESARIEELLDDDILMDVLRGDAADAGAEGGSAGVAWVFKKTCDGGGAAAVVGGSRIENRES